MSRLLDDVVRELSRLPGVGRRTALRLAMHILRSREDDVAQMIRAIGDFRTSIRYCSRCNNLSDNDLCDICSDPSRDRTTICIVEQVGDVLSIEKTGQYRGLYHVLGGVISPMAGIAPSDLKIDLLINNIVAATDAVHPKVKEVILAISTTVEGETTLFYILNRLRGYKDLKITTIARGIGFGDEIEYADELTISHAIANRREVGGEL
jgi:recombination protein RecR